jgi:hypothetical protein
MLKLGKKYSLCAKIQFWDETYKTADNSYPNN